MDYHKFCTKDTSVKKRRKFNVGDWWINAIKCGKCGETIRSKDRHDYVVCSCGSCAVDGGSWYLRRCCIAEHEELSKLFDNLPQDYYK